MHYLSSVYFVNQPLHVSCMSVAHHQEVYCIYTTTGTCCALQLTVCRPAGRPTVSQQRIKLVFITQLYREAGQRNIKFRPDDNSREMKHVTLCVVTLKCRAGRHIVVLFCDSGKDLRTILQLDSMHARAYKHIHVS